MLCRLRTFGLQINIWDPNAKERHQDERKKKEYIVKIFTLFDKKFRSAGNSPNLKERENFFKSNKKWFSNQEDQFHSPGMEAAVELEAGSDYDTIDDSDCGSCGIKDWDGSDTDSDDSCADNAAGNSDGSAVVRSEVIAVLGHVPEQQLRKCTTL